MSPVRRSHGFWSSIRWCARHLLPAGGLLLIAFAIFSVAEPERRAMRRMQIPNVPLPARLLPARPSIAQNQRPLSNYPVIVLDPGHGGMDDGASANGLREKDLTLDLSKRAAARLQEMGFPVVVTRGEDVYVSLADRVAVANACPGSLMVSLHFNQSSDPTIHGVETFYATAKAGTSSRWPWANLFSALFSHPEDEAGRKLAGCLQHNVAVQLGDTDRGTRPRDLYVVRHTNQPAVLIEGAFLSNPNQAMLLRTDAYRERIAAGVVAGICAYVGGTKSEVLQMARK